MRNSLTIVGTTPLKIQTDQDFLKQKIGSLEQKIVGLKAAYPQSPMVCCQPSGKPCLRTHADTQISSGCFWLVIYPITVYL